MKKYFNHLPLGELASAMALPLLMLCILFSCEPTTPDLQVAQVPAYDIHVAKQHGDICTFHFPESTKRAVSLKSAYWSPDEIIEVGFEDASDQQKFIIEEVCREIEQFTGLSFRFGKPFKEAKMRVGFREGQGSWSALGRYSQGRAYKDDINMNLGWFPHYGTYTEADVGTVRHEIAHFLAVLHEHQNPDAEIMWNDEVVYAELSRPPNSWDRETIRWNVLSKKDPKTVNHTGFDPKSVMLYWFPDRWTLNGKGTKSNNKFSELDKQHLAKLYPPKKEPAPVVLNKVDLGEIFTCLLYTSPSPRDATLSRMPSSA